MNVLIFNTFSFAPSFTSVVFDEIQTQIDLGNNVTHVTCGGTFSLCGFNFGLKYGCEICKYRLQKALPLVDGEFTTIKIGDYINELEDRIADGFVTDDISIDWDLYYEDFDIGESVLSSYISKTRDRDLVLDDSRETQLKILKNALKVYLAIKRLFAERNIDKLIVFNGRWDYYRAAFRAAQSIQIPVLAIENFRTGGYKEYFPDSLPHNMDLKGRKMEECWQLALTPENQKIALGETFFTRKRKGEVVVDKAYSKGYVKRLLPEGIDLNRKSIVLFNSSDDEFAAVGKDYRKTLFRNQVEGIDHLIELIGKKYHEFQLIIRMHPNLSGLEFSYVSDVLSCHKRYDNIFVVPPESKVDSYSLIELAWKVVTFGSTIGVEATFFGRPVILLAKTYYWKMNVAYVPDSLSEVEEYILQELQPKPRLNALKIGYYFLNGGTKAKYYNSNGRKAFFFKEVDMMKIDLLSRIYFKFLKVLRIKNSDLHKN
jgi:hypothetical protein